jgi:hypothetical protein
MSNISRLWLALFACNNDSKRGTIRQILPDVYTCIYWEGRGGRKLGKKNNSWLAYQQYAIILMFEYSFKQMKDGGTGVKG